MSGSLRNLTRRWLRSAIGKVVDYTMERLEEIDAELGIDEDEIEDEEFDTEEWQPPRVVQPGRMTSLDEPVATDDVIFPDLGWVEIPLVNEDGSEVISLQGTRGDNVDTIDIDAITRLVPRDELPDGSLKLMGIRAVCRDDESAVVGLIRNLRVGDTPNLFMHSGWAQLDAFDSLRELRAYPRFIAEDDISAEVTAWGEGAVICTVSIYLDVISPVDVEEDI